ncbi:hypothetical protein IT397_03355 [Candidatus Nomurabacteria bacterium]|nr:hypothetical protein [Candidatus Nomurabacteria bacterium]
MSKINQKRGLVGTIVVIIVAIIVLSYLGFDLRKIFQSEYMQSNFSYIGEILRKVWENYLARPIIFLWERVVLPLLNIAWNAFTTGLDKLKSVDTSGLDSTK